MRLCCHVPCRQLPSRTDEVAGVAVGDALQVVLVLGFGLPEGSRGGQFGDDLSGPQAGGVDVGDSLFGDTLLLRASVVDRRAIAQAPVVTLAVQRRRIVD